MRPQNNKSTKLWSFPGTVLLVIALLLCVAGCRREARLKGLVPAHGVITYNGAPVEKAHVFLNPVQVPGDARIGFAITQKDGTFEMTSLQPKDGVLPGTYKMVVKKIDSTPIKEDDDPTPVFLRVQTDASPQTQALSPQESLAKNLAATVHLLPRKYADPATSDLEIEIGRRGDTNLRIDLKD